MREVRVLSGINNLYARARERLFFVGCAASVAATGLCGAATGLCGAAGEFCGAAFHSNLLENLNLNGHKRLKPHSYCMSQRLL